MGRSKAWKNPNVMRRARPTLGDHLRAAQQSPANRQGELCVSTATSPRRAQGPGSPRAVQACFCPVFGLGTTCVGPSCTRHSPAAGSQPSHIGP